MPAFSAAELRRLNTEVMACFPAEPGGETRVVLLEVHPRQVHVYWYARAQDLARNAPLVLRVHDVAYMDFSGANPHATWEIVLDAPYGQRYLDIPGDGKTLIAELGIRGAYRQLSVLARSAPLRLPPGGAAAHATAPRIAPSRPAGPAVAHAAVQARPGATDTETKPETRKPYPGAVGMAAAEPAPADLSLARHGPPLRPWFPLADGAHARRYPEAAARLGDSLLQAHYPELARRLQQTGWRPPAADALPLRPPTTYAPARTDLFPACFSGSRPVEAG